MMADPYTLKAAWTVHLSFRPVRGHAANFFSTRPAPGLAQTLSEVGKPIRRRAECKEFALFTAAAGRKL
jgi:hypothetical protein